MSLKGGYKIIDLKNIPLTSGTGVTIDGIYKSIVNSYGKPLLLSGINVGGATRNDIYVGSFSSTSDTYTFTLSATETLAITNADLVTLTVTA